MATAVVAVAARDRAPAGGDEVVELERQSAPARAAAVPVQRLDAFVGAEAGEVAAVPLLARHVAPSAPLVASFSAAYSWMLRYIPKYGSSMS